MSEAPDLSSLLAQSASTDISVLLKAKEDAKRLVRNDPSPANLASMDKATRMLDAAQSQVANLKDVNSVLDYVKEAGRKLQKTKLYEDIGIGRLKRQPDGSFRRRDVDRYAASLPTAGTSDKVAKDAADRHKRKEEEEIRRIKAAADRDEFRHAVERGKYISRDEVFQELAGRALTLAYTLRAAFESKATELIYHVEGKPKHAQAFVQAFEEMLDAALNEYSQVEAFLVEIQPAFGNAEDDPVTPDDEEGHDDQ